MCSRIHALQKMAENMIIVATIVDSTRLDTTLLKSTLCIIAFLNQSDDLSSSFGLVDFAQWPNQMVVLVMMVTAMRMMTTGRITTLMELGR